MSAAWWPIGCAVALALAVVPVTRTVSPLPRLAWIGVWLLAAGVDLLASAADLAPPSSPTRLAAQVATACAAASVLALQLRAGRWLALAVALSVLPFVADGAALVAPARVVAVIPDPGSAAAWQYAGAGVLATRALPWPLDAADLWARLLLVLAVAWALANGRVPARRRLLPAGLVLAAAILLGLQTWLALAAGPHVPGLEPSGTTPALLPAGGWRAGLALLALARLATVLALLGRLDAPPAPAPRWVRPSTAALAAALAWLVWLAVALPWLGAPALLAPQGLALLGLVFAAVTMPEHGRGWPAQLHALLHVLLAAVAAGGAAAGWSA